MLSLLLLRLPLLLLSLAAMAAHGNQESELVSDWVNSIRWMQPGESIFELAPGDSLELNCRGMRHVAKIRVNMELEWRLLDRPLTDEGSTGRIQLLEDNGRLTVENVNGRDSGLYATYARRGPLEHLLDLPSSGNESPGEVQGAVVNAGDRADKVEAAKASHLAVCLFVVRVDSLRNYTLREGDVFNLKTSTWLKPLSDTLIALGMPRDEWRLTWYREIEEIESCNKMSTCELKFTATREHTAGVWRLEMRSLNEKNDHRRILVEFLVSVRPPLGYLETFPLATHKYYMVLSSLVVGLFLLSLHLFNNLNWTPFAFDLLPDQVSPKAVLDQAGVFLKESRV